MDKQSLTNKPHQMVEIPDEINGKMEKKWILMEKKCMIKQKEDGLELLLYGLLLYC